MTTKILIVDDDQYTRQVLGQILLRDKLTAQLKVQIIEAPNGVVAIEEFEKHKPHLVIVDLFMPKMDGFAVCKRLRELAGPEELTIAVMSGVYKDPSIPAKLQEDYGAHFFAKPYQLKNVAAFVAQSLDAPQPAAQPGSQGSSPARDKEKRESPRSSKSQPPSSGKLDPQHAAARLFWDFMEKEATGRLILRRAPVVRQVELFVGHPVKVTTNVREETLGNFLVMRNCVNKDAQRKAMSLAASKNVRLGEAFLEMELLTPQQLIKELTAQTRYKLTQALRWTTGSWTFREGVASNSGSDALDFARLIVTGLSDTTRVQSPSPEVAALSRCPLELNARGSAILREIATHISSRFSEQFEPGVTMEELRSNGVSRAQLFRSLDVLVSCGGLDVGTVSTSAALRGKSGVPLKPNLKKLAGDNLASANLYSGLFASDEDAGGNSGSFPLKQLGSEQLWDAALSTEEEEGSSPLDLFGDDDNSEKPVAKSGVEATEEDRNQNFEEESAVNVSFSSIAPNAEHADRKQLLLGEYLRINEKSYYDTLGVSTNVSEEEIRGAYISKLNVFPRDKFTADILGRSYGKLGIILDAYQQAQRVLLDPHERQRYDRTLRISSQSIPDAPSMDADIAFQEAEQRLAEGRSKEAIGKLEAAIEISPREHAYHATLGWAYFIDLGQDLRAADQAHIHINKALAMAPDSALVHEYKGLIHAKLQDDPRAAIKHLSRALEMDPKRDLALAAIEKLYLASESYQELERLYRQMLRQGGEENDSATLWKRLGSLYQNYLRNPKQALEAYREALKRSPEDAQLLATCLKLRTIGGGPTYYESCSGLIAEWRSAPGHGKLLRPLLRLASGVNHYDGQFLATSALVCVGQDAKEDTLFYRRFQPRFLLRAQRGIGPREWEALLHPRDHALVGSLYALLDSVLQALHPNKAAQREVEQAALVDESSVSQEIRTTRRYVSRVLGVAEPAIFLRSDYGSNMELASLATPVLLAGPQTLACTSKIELAFRLGRAMSFLRPGRATAASSRSRVLKSAMMACYSIRSPSANIPDPDGSVRAFREAIHELEPQIQKNAVDLVDHISREHPSLNLSRWTRTLARTADRCGLLLCGDLPLAMRCLSEPLESEMGVELLAFGVSPSHMRLREAMALSIQV